MRSNSDNAAQQIRMASERVPRSIMCRIVTGQLLATSMWFAPNAVLGTLQPLWGIAWGEGTVTSAVQFGFICGTLLFAVLGLADRLHACRVFLSCAIVGALANIAMIGFPAWFEAVLATRFLVGLCLAGIYPVGMKIAAGWYQGGLGRALGFLVGALVLGTSLPHLLKALGQSWDWHFVMAGSSAAAVLGGLLVVSVPEGPFAGRGAPVRFRGVLRAFRVPRFRAAVLGYFGHMWELYALWAFVPVWMTAYGLHGRALSLTAFGVIVAGAVGCILGGLLVRRWGGGAVALSQLAVSGAFCLASPLLFAAPLWLLLPLLLLWGFAAAGDSPQFSALNAQNAPPQLVGSALTLTNSLGFAISIGSLALLEALQLRIAPQWLFLVLAPGPAFGLWAGRALLR